jgi:hypothetical protein
MTLQTTGEDIFFRVFERPVYWKDKQESFHEAGHKALLRLHPDRPTEPVQLAIVKDSYKLVTNLEIVASLETILSNYDTEVHTLTDRGGARCYLDVKFNNLQTAFNNDPVNFRAIFWNGYGGSSFGCKVGAIWSWCTNGSIFGEYEATYKRHSSGLDVSAAEDWIKAGMKKWDVETVEWQEWRDKPSSYHEAKEACTKMTDNDGHVTKMLGRFDGVYCPRYGTNRFSLYQTLTDFATHFDDYKLRRIASNSNNERTITMLARAERVMKELAA